jgi:peptidyl-prolyl cis-trans isomerase C/peptidyl-prolyl cis-trans isomerase SurA
MVLTDKKLSILTGVASVLLVLTVIVYSGGFLSSAKDFASGSLLIQGLDPQKVSRITIDKGSDSLALQRTAQGFTITQRQGYPASTEKVNALFIKCLEIRCDGKITENKDNHKDLGVVADDKEATVVKLLDNAGKVITGVVVGGSASRSRGVYVRPVDKDIVYVTDKWVSFSTKVSDFVDSELVKVAKDDVVEVRVEQKDSTYISSRDKDGGVVLKDVPKGKRAKKSDVESLFDALSDLSLDDIAVDAAVAANPDTTFTCKTSKHATYTVKLAEKDDKHYVKLSVKGPDDELIRKSMMIGQNEPQAELDKKAAVLTANDKAKAFNLRHNNWVYEIASWSAGKLRKPLTDLIEDIPKDEVPEKVTASHILIGYKGADRSKATRTKAEARKLSEDVLAKVKAHGANFAELAKKHSEGPSGAKGGDLGEFGKGMMHKNFEEATWKLKVGEISGIVETPFGFHVIKRTK